MIFKTEIDLHNPPRVRRAGPSAIDDDPALCLFSELTPFPANFTGPTAPQYSPCYPSVTRPKRASSVSGPHLGKLTPRVHQTPQLGAGLGPQTRSLGPVQNIILPPDTVYVTFTLAIYTCLASSLFFFSFSRQVTDHLARRRYSAFTFCRRLVIFFPTNVS